ncbi:MAG: saccharopine dehydrogenase-like NADP-dependent oxidoreductase [Phenylobacterium sp.]|jgi:saccharopine dehydrogenase-like NADP-dependent oxidoreductase
MTNTIHWLGAGLSSTPGIKRLASGANPVIVWNRSLEKAQASLASLKGKSKDKLDIRALDWDNLSETVNAGDVVISMLPATMHLKVADLCLSKDAHFVSSSYISPEMAAIDAQAKAQNLCFVNEVGLDPGLDHLLAHSLVNNYKNAECFAPGNQHYFRSYCGGFPKVANDFKYKFSWSPLGVLKALRSPAQWLSQGQPNTSQAPWEALSEYHAQFANGKEMFQAYPNRDSLPFVSHYGFEDNWDVQEFVRGTLRLAGWSTAWQGIFDEVAQLSGEAGDLRLQQISRELEQKHSYDAGEPDRVVLCVELEVRSKDDGKTIWHQSYQLDSCGNAVGQAMARLVSLPVSLAVEAVIAGDISVGVSAAPSAPELVSGWLNKLEQLGEVVSHSDHLID